jgi:Pyruvate/2-oxoacid:ferredoxin oxidoreductase gamma subunit
VWEHRSVPERELVMTGIGGQGVQLAAQLLARALVAEGRDVLLFGSYGGMMRGGNTDATLLMADARVQSPPTVTDAWSAVVMHHEHWPAARRRLRPDAFVVLNTTIVDAGAWSGPGLPVAAGAIAMELGSAAVATMVALGAYAAATGAVRVDALVDALAETLPPYRQQHRAVNEEALHAGAALVPGVLRPAWEVVAA